MGINYWRGTLRWCYPTRLSFPRDKTLGATLYLDVLGARSVEVQHLQPIILDRINLIFGYTAVAKHLDSASSEY